MKKIIYIFYSFIFLSSFVIISCSEMQSDITLPSSISIHKEGVSDPASENFHGKIIKQLNWNLKNCQQCHGYNYSGGITNASCLDCHKFPGGPESCNTCHGDFYNLMDIAPPRDLSGEVSTSARGVGAHYQHLGGNKLGMEIVCSECHKVPRGLNDEGHIDGLPAEIIFGPFASYRTTEENKPAYNQSSISCSNTYCHGNFSSNKNSASELSKFAYTDSVMLGNNSNPIWNKVDGNFSKCNSCHGKSEIDPSPVGHINTTIAYCGEPFCHPGVVDNTGKIIDQSKHINGKINVRGVEYEH